jgi:hypothetical protein
MSSFAALRQIANRVLPRQIARPLRAVQLFPPVRFLWDARFRREVRCMRELRNRTQSTVISGPFKGLQYTGKSTGSAYGPKLLGTYELELWPAVAEILRTDYSVIIDVGAAEGYYAVGLATLVPAARVIAFEALEREHHLIHDLAARNKATGRIEVRGSCTAESLKVLVTSSSKTLLICDAEGAEKFVLDPARVPALACVDILVELHDFIVPGVGDEIRTRFSSTHDIQTIASQPRLDQDWPSGFDFPADLKAVAMEERRPVAMEWLWMKARG